MISTVTTDRQTEVADVATWPTRSLEAQLCLSSHRRSARSRLSVGVQMGEAIALEADDQRGRSHPEVFGNGVDNRPARAASLGYRMAQLIARRE